MRKAKLIYERLKMAVVVWSAADVVSCSGEGEVSRSEEDTEKDFFSPFEW